MCRRGGHEKKETEEAGHGEVAHCCRVTVCNGWAVQEMQGEAGVSRRVKGRVRSCRRNKCQEETSSGVGWGGRVGGGGWKQNKRQTQEIVIRVDISMCDVRHLHMVTRPLNTTFVMKVVNCKPPRRPSLFWHLFLMTDPH